MSHSDGPKGLPDVIEIPNNLGLNLDLMICELKGAPKNKTTTADFPSGFPMGKTWPPMSRVLGVHNVGRFCLRRLGGELPANRKWVSSPQ